MAITYTNRAVRSAFRLYPDAYVTDKGIVRDQPYQDLPEVLVSYIGPVGTEGEEDEPEDPEAG